VEVDVATSVGEQRPHPKQPYHSRLWRHVQGRRLQAIDDVARFNEVALAGPTKQRLDEDGASGGAPAVLTALEQQVQRGSQQVIASSTSPRANCSRPR
jgi:hypothetical protein